MFLRILRYSGWFVVGLFALIGFVLVFGFFALRFGWTKTAGVVDLNDRYFKDVSAQMRNFNNSGEQDSASSIYQNNCRLLVLSRLSPGLGRSLLNAYMSSNSEKVLAKSLLAAEVFLNDNQNYKKGVELCVKSLVQLKGLNVSNDSVNSPYGWINSGEWPILREAIIKDQAQIKKVSEQTGVSERLLVTMLVGEQLRLYNSEREVYKEIFQPLKILGVQSKFSWGVMGMKEETARQVEINLKDKKSPFYLGSTYENLLNFKSANIDSERFERLVDEHNHYYSYLYTALYLKQIMAEWRLAGYNIDDRPEILATLFNLGFAKSAPKADPKVGGAEIEVGGQTYSFGSLAFQFYYSGELIDYFSWQ